MKTPAHAWWHVMLSRAFIKHIRGLIVAVAILLVPASVAAISLDFEQTDYAGAPGDVLLLRLAFAAPVPNGLDAYSLRLDFPYGMFDVQSIAIVAELDHDLFAENPAFREIGPDHVAVTGFAEWGSPYTGTAFIEIEVIIGIDAPAGDRYLTLSMPHENSFIDGTMQSIDEDLILGSAGMTVIVPIPAFVSPINVDPVTNTYTLHYTGLPGRRYTIEVSYDLKTWHPLVTLTAPPSGVGAFTDSTTTIVPYGFYRVVD